MRASRGVLRDGITRSLDRLKRLANEPDRSEAARAGARVANAWALQDGSGEPAR